MGAYEIPDSVWDALDWDAGPFALPSITRAVREPGENGPEWDVTTLMQRAAEEIVPLAIAAELERITGDGTGWAIETHLRKRAAELRGE